VENHRMMQVPTE